MHERSTPRICFVSPTKRAASSSGVIAGRWHAPRFVMSSRQHIFPFAARAPFFGSPHATIVCRSLVPNALLSSHERPAGFPARSACDLIPSGLARDFDSYPLNLRPLRLLLLLLLLQRLLLPLLLLLLLLLPLLNERELNVRSEQRAACTEMASRKARFAKGEPSPASCRWAPCLVSSLAVINRCVRCVIF